VSLPLVHLVNPLWDPHGGADWRTIATYRLLREAADVRLWTEYEPHAQFERDYPIARIKPLRLSLPRRGTLVFMGTYFRIGHWIRFAGAERVVLIYNTHQPDRLAKNLRRLRGAGTPTEVVFTSQALRRLVGGHGPVLESPIDPQRFHPNRGVRGPGHPFTVGRMSRDIRTKHHAEDPALWRALAAAGYRVRLMGATCLAGELGATPGIEILPAGAEDPATFLRSLDCFVYRTSADWFEAYGRVVMEAMATGLSIVAARRGGYVDHLRHEVNALLFDGTHEAYEHVLRVAKDKPMAARLGVTARHHATSFNRDYLPARTIALLATPQPQTAFQFKESVS
jgi:glycosyltransferase involved in cell wall biosynthesis